MKWSVQQLRKIQNFPHKFSVTLDFTNYIESVNDILGIGEVEVTGTINRINDDTYNFNYHMKAPLIVECALTLDPVNYVIENDYNEIYSLEEKDEYFLIEKNTINLEEIVWTNILIEKPINVTLPNAYEILKSRGIVLDDTEKLDEDEEVLFYADGLEDSVEEDKN